MITFACVKWGKRYSAEYVNILFDAVQRNLAQGTEGKFVCFTDDAEGISPGILVKKLPAGLVGWWNKLWLFNKNAFPAGERIIYIDLDTLVIGALDDIIAFNGAFGVLTDPYHPGSFNSSFMIWTAGEQCHIWDKWNADGKPDLPTGDQEWIESCVKDFKFLQREFPETFYSYKEHCYPYPPLTAKIVYFHGEPKPHNCGQPWVYKVWKIGGNNLLSMQVMPNTTDAALMENVKINAARDLPWVSSIPAHEGHAVIVGSGPSLLDTIEEIKKRQLFGQKIFALNNAASILVDNGIIPDYQVILDARPENVSLICKSAKEFLLGSQVHPDVFDACPPRVRVWHALMDNMESVFPKRDTPYALIGGGTTVGLSAMCLAYTLGYRFQHLYGYDSSHKKGASHAAVQNINSANFTIEVMVGEEVFTSYPAMAVQAQKFPLLAQQLADLGVVITVHGDGLLPAIARQVEASASVPYQSGRAEALLKRLGDGPVVGAEIGVFCGATSSRLLSKENLTLYMVDSWEHYEPDSEYALSGDKIADFSKDIIEDVYQRVKATFSYYGDRARIMRMRSTDAAKMVQDGSLDFVFIDADHTYNGCMEDILAWSPKLKRGGILSGHDYKNVDFPGFKVTEAVNDFASSHGLTVETDEDFTWFIIWPNEKTIKRIA